MKRLIALSLSLVILFSVTAGADTLHSYGPFASTPVANVFCGPGWANGTGRYAYSVSESGTTWTVQVIRTDALRTLKISPSSYCQDVPVGTSLSEVETLTYRFSSVTWEPRLCPGVCLPGSFFRGVALHGANQATVSLTALGKTLNVGPRGVRGSI